MKSFSIVYEHEEGMSALDNVTIYADWLRTCRCSEMLAVIDYSLDMVSAGRMQLHFVERENPFTLRVRHIVGVVDDTTAVEMKLTLSSVEFEDFDSNRAGPVESLIN